MVKCSFFAKGFCSRGTECRFEHDAVLTWPPPALPGVDSVATYTTGARRRAMVCKFYAQGRCTKGAECPFEHIEPTVAMDEVALGFQHMNLMGGGLGPRLAEGLQVALPIVAYAADSRSTVPCRFFQHGQCNNEACPYLHEGGDVGCGADKDVDDDQV